MNTYRYVKLWSTTIAVSFTIMYLMDAALTLINVKGTFTVDVAGPYIMCVIILVFMWSLFYVVKFI